MIDKSRYTAEVLAEGFEDIAERQHRILRQAVRLCVAVEHADPVMLEDSIRDAAAGFRAAVEENA